MKWPSLQQILDSLTDGLTWVKGLIYAFFIYLGIEIEFFAILCVLMLFDTIFGAISAIKEKNFTSKRLLWGLVEKSMLITFPLLLALVGKLLGRDYTLLPDIVISIMGGVEFLSIIGHLYWMRTGNKLKHMDLISIMMVNVKKVIEKALIGIINAFKDGVENGPEDKSESA